MDIWKTAFKRIGTAAAILVGIAASAWLSDHKPNINDYYNSGSEDILTADDLRQLRWMSTDQLRAIFNGHQDTVRVENSPEAYKELKWMSTDQLRAIFGSKDIL